MELRESLKNVVEAGYEVASKRVRLCHGIVDEKTKAVGYFVMDFNGKPYDEYPCKDMDEAINVFVAKSSEAVDKP